MVTPPQSEKDVPTRPKNPLYGNFPGRCLTFKMRQIICLHTQRQILIAPYVL
jgi:hypothetical protein